MRAAAATALKQMRSEAGADSLARWHRRVRFGESPLASLAPVAALAPPQERDSTGDRQVSDPHPRPVLDRQRCPATPTAAGHLDEHLDLDLELPAYFDHVRHDHAIDPGKTANVIPHSLFLLVRVFDNAKPERSSGCLRYPSLNPARLARPTFQPGECPTNCVGTDAKGASCLQLEMLVLLFERMVLIGPAPASRQASRRPRLGSLTACRMTSAACSRTR
jgi:hypothetical protein